MLFSLVQSTRLGWETLLLGKGELDGLKLVFQNSGNNPQGRNPSCPEYLEVSPAADRLIAATWGSLVCTNYLKIKGIRTKAIIYIPNNKSPDCGN